MKCQSKIDIHTDSGYRRLDTAEDIKGYGMRGLTMMRRGVTTDGRQVVNLLDSICKSHRLVIRSIYGSEVLAAAHGMADVCPTIVALIEIASSARTPEQVRRYREQGNMDIYVT